jgi:hypothetical protein
MNALETPPNVPMTANYGPSIVLGLLFEKQSANGRQYFIGRLGKAKVALLRSREVSESGDPVWEIRLEQAPDAPMTYASALTAEQATAKLFKHPARRRLPKASNGTLPDLPNDDIADLYSRGEDE